MTAATGGLLLVGRALHPPWNEGTRVIGRSVAEVAAERLPVSVLSLTRPEFLDAVEPGLPVDHLRARGAYGMVGDYLDLPALARRMHRTLGRVRPAVVHLVSVPLALAPLARRHGARVVVHVTLTEHVYRGRVEAARAWAGGRAWERFVDAYAAASEPVRRGLVDGGAPAGRVEVVGPPIDVAQFSPRPRAAARRALDMDPDAFVVAYVGTVSPARFPADDVARALRAAAPDVPGLALEAFAPVRTHAYNVDWARTNVQQALDASGVRGRIRLEDLDLERKALVYSAADVLLVPFTAPVAVEPPLTLLEGLACGAAVAVAPAANRSEIVRAGRNGATFDGPEALAETLRRLHAAGPAGREALGRRGRDDVVATFGREATLAALERVWRVAGAHLPPPTER